MVVKVIGDDPKFIKQTSCSNCAAKLEYIKEDERRGVDRDYTGSSDSYQYISCPRCSKEVRIK